MAVAYVRDNGSTGTSVSLDVGTQGTNRLVVVYLNDESNPGGSFSGSVTTDGKTAVQGVVANNSDGAGSHSEMHYFTESDLTDTEGTQTLSFSGGDSGWAIHAILYTGVTDGAPSDTDIDDTTIGDDPSVDLDVPAGGVVFGLAANGSSGSAGSWTSPLTERTDGPNPASAVMATASGTEASAQTGKTYGVTIGNGTLRSSMIGASWAEAVVAGIDDVDSDYGSGADEFDLDDASLDVNSLASSFAASSNDMYLSADDTLAGGSTEVDISAGITAEDADQITLDLTDLTTELADLESLVATDGHDLFLIVDTGSDEYSLAVTVHRAKAFQLAASSNIGASGANTTVQLTAPSGKTTGDFGGGRIQDDENPGDAVDAGDDEYREDETAFEAITPTDGTYLGAQADETYQFRLVLSDGTPFGTYTVTPETTIGTGEVSGDAAIAEQSDTLAATGGVEIAGDGALAEQQDSASAAGGVEISGDGALVEQSDALSATGGVQGSGGGALTEQADALSATGGVQISGDGAIAEQSDVVAALGDVPISGDGALAEQADSVSALGDVPISGDGALTEQSDSLSAAGDVGDTVDGSATILEQPDSVTATGGVPVSGAGAIAEQPDTLAATGNVGDSVDGTGAISEASDTLASVGGVEVAGSGAITEQPDTVTGLSSAEEIEGSSAITESGDTLTATGGVQVSSAGVVNELMDLVAATGSVEITGIGDIAESSDVLAASQSPPTRWRVEVGASLVVTEDGSGLVGIIEGG